MTLPFDQTPYMSHPHQFFAQMYTTQHHQQQQPLIPLPAPQHHHAHPQPQDPFAGEPSSSSAGGVERKRPKYTRSKTGCMTCRHKKIKCDERKPVCSRCSHGQRECTWPEGLPKKKAAEAKRKRNTSEEGDEENPNSPRRSNSPPNSANPSSAGAADAAFNGLLSPTSPRHPYPSSYNTNATTSGAAAAAAVAAAAAYGTYRQPLPSPQYPPTPISGGSHFSSSAGGFPPTPVSAQFRNGANAASTSSNRPSRSSSASTGGGLNAFDPSLLALPSISNASPYSTGNHTPNASYTGSPNPSEDYHSGGEASGSYSSDTAYSSGASAGGHGGATAGSGGSGGQAGAVEKFYLPGEKLYYTGEKEKHWNANGGSTMFTSPDPIEPYFRTVQERNLVGTRSFF